jgi:DNA invertase Pin-like site-specific DNA recombinase
MRGVKLPEETIATIRRLRAKGHSIREICQAVGHGTGCVHSHTKGIKLPFGPRKSGPAPRVLRSVCRDLRRQGMTYRAIASRFGCAVSAVHRAIHS